MAVLDGNKLRLRPIALQDVSDEYVAWLNDKEVKRGLESPPDNYSKELLVGYLKKILPDKEVHMYAIIARDKNKHIGNIKLHNFNFNSATCELGIMIGNKDYWGKGYGKEACLLLINHAFDELKIRKVWLSVHSNNVSAIELYKKIGFDVEGCLKQHTLSEGKLVDKIIMGIFRNK